MRFFISGSQKEFLRYTLLLMLPVTVMAVIAGMVIYQNNVSATFEKNKLLEKDMVSLQKEIVAGDFALVFSDLTFLARHTERFETLTLDSKPFKLAYEFRDFLANKPFYDQIRVLDVNGIERVRVNNSEMGIPRIIDEDKLQDKSQRYYFKNTIDLNRGEVYVSPMDLNMEDGKIELPIKPTIRFCMPIFDASGNKRGVLVINYLGNSLLERFAKAAGDTQKQHHSCLLDAAGYCMRDEENWKNMLAEPTLKSFMQKHTYEWYRISASESGQFVSKENGLYTFVRLSPRMIAKQYGLNLEHINIKTETYFWTIVSHLAHPRELVMAGTLKTRIILLTLGGVLLFFGGAWVLADALVGRKETEQNLFETESRYRALVDYSPDGIVVYRDSIIIFINQRGAALLGADHPNEIIGRNMKEFVSAYDLLGVKERESKLLAGEAVAYPVELSMICFDGQVKRFEAQASCALWDGEPVIQAVVRDISERKKTEKKLQQLSQAMEYAGEAIVITDNQGVIEYVNPAFVSLTGYSEEEAIGQTSRILKSGKQSASFYEEIWKTILSGQIWHGRVIDRRKDGSLYPTMLTIAPVLMPGELHCTHFVAIHSDLSKLDEMEKQFHQAQKMEALGTLVGGVAHDFNNMLAGIIGLLFLTREEVKDKPEAIANIDKMEEVAMRAANMVKQMLTFSRKDKIEVKPLPFHIFVKETLKFLRASIPENIKISQQICTDSLVVMGDNTQLHQVLMNLLNNARDALDGVSKPHIKITLKLLHADDAFIARHTSMQTGDYAHLMVADNGCGIADEQISRLFEPFYTTKEVGKGTGLGLAMVFGAINNHHGYIEVESKQGEGTVFHVYLPLVSLNEEECLFERAQVMRGQGECILLVDDDVDVLQTGKKVLETLGYRVISANNGRYALKMFNMYKDDIDVCILDIVMPVMDGVQAAALIREEKPAINIIFATGYDRDNKLDMTNETVIHKPFSIDEISRLIRQKLDA